MDISHSLISEGDADGEAGLSISAVLVQYRCRESATMSLMALLEKCGLNKSPNLLKPHFSHLSNGTSPPMVPMKVNESMGAGRLCVH